MHEHVVGGGHKGALHAGGKADHNLREVDLKMGNQYLEKKVLLLIVKSK